MLRVASIAFLNPAPLLYDFEHPPRAAELRHRYALHYTTPAQCAAELHAGPADLGLIPIAALTPALAIVPGCTIASLDEVRSILLLVKNPDLLDETEALKQVRTLAADAASRSSQAYAHILFHHFLNRPHHPRAARRPPRNARHRRRRAPHRRPRTARPRAPRRNRCRFNPATPLARSRRPLAPPHRSAVGRRRLGGPPRSSCVDPAQLTTDLNASRENGLAHIDQLVAEWTPRLALPPETIRTYLTRNIHYTLDPACLESIHLFRTLAAEIDLLPPLRTLRML